MSVPQTVDDGNFALAQQNECDELNFPFFDKADNYTFEVVRTKRVDVASFRTPKMMAQIRKYGRTLYLVDITQPVRVGAALLEWQEIYSVVPATRTEYTNLTYAIQLPSFGTSYDWETPPPEPTITEIPVPLTAKVIYEYSIEPLPVLIAPRIAIVNGTLLKYGGWGVFVSGQQYLAYDSELRLYKGRIYERRSVYITYPEVTRGRIEP